MHSQNGRSKLVVIVALFLATTPALANWAASTRLIGKVVAYERSFPITAAGCAEIWNSQQGMCEAKFLPEEEAATVVRVKNEPAPAILRGRNGMYTISLEMLPNGYRIRAVASYGNSDSTEWSNVRPAVESLVRSLESNPPAAMVHTVD